jgi:hypothetical protein
VKWNGSKGNHVLSVQGLRLGEDPLRRDLLPLSCASTPRRQPCHLLDPEQFRLTLLELSNLLDGDGVVDDLAEVFSPVGFDDDEVSFDEREGSVGTVEEVGSAGFELSYVKERRRERLADEETGWAGNLRGEKAYPWTRRCKG